MEGWASHPGRALQPLGGSACLRLLLPWQTPRNVPGGARQGGLSQRDRAGTWHGTAGWGSHEEGDGAGKERSRAVLTQRDRWQENKSPLGINPPDSPGKRQWSMLRGRLRAITAIISFAMG